MYSSFSFDTINLGWSILYIEGSNSQVIISHLETHMCVHIIQIREYKCLLCLFISEKHNHFCTFFTAITKKRMSEEKKLNVGLQKYTVLKRDYVHQKHDVSIFLTLIHLLL